MSDPAPANPLLDFAGLTRFDAIRPEHIMPAVEALLAECRAAVRTVTGAAGAASWENVAAPLDDCLERLARAWTNVSHLNAVVDTPELREQYNAALPAVTAFWTALSQDEALYARYKALAARPDFAGWPAARRKIVANELRDFRLGGAELPLPGKQRLKQVREELSQLTTRFAENVLDATNAFELIVDDAARLAGVPADVVQMYREAAAADGKPGYKISLHYPSYLPIQQYAQDRALREQLYRAYVTRASELGEPGKPDWDNGPVLLAILRLRAESAVLLGYADFAEVSLATKMAERPAAVLRFLQDLAQRAKPFAERDMAELREFAARELGLPELQAWDLAYAGEKLREARYAYSEHALRQYFTEPAVLAGLFRVIETLFSVAIRPDAAPTWHPDVKFFRVQAQSESGELLGQFYLDLYARDHKQGGAWQDDARIRRRLRAEQSPDSVQTPVSFITCNFSKPVGGKPALLSHDDVLTLFHEFGHALHHLLTRVDEPAVSGLRGVEWDAVELPSQFMENFAWEWEVLQLLTAHVDTGAALPRALYDKMIAARNFQSGMQMVRQLELALFDMRAHTALDASRATQADVQRLIDAVRRAVAVVFPPPYHRLAHAFTHVFAGGYAAGYYSYKWAEVLSADCYAAFEDDVRERRAGSVLNAQRGGQFRDQILAVGGSRLALESFVAFRGREPHIDALLRHNGMA